MKSLTRTVCSSLRDNPASYVQSYDCTESATCPHGARRSMWSKSWDVLRLAHGGPRRPASGYNVIHLCLFRTAMLSPGSSVVPRFRRQVATHYGVDRGTKRPRWEPMASHAQSNQTGIERTENFSPKLCSPTLPPACWLDRKAVCRSPWIAFRQDRRARSMAFFTHF